MLINGTRSSCTTVLGVGDCTLESDNLNSALSHVVYGYITLSIINII